MSKSAFSHYELKPIATLTNVRRYFILLSIESVILFCFHSINITVPRIGGAFGGKSFDPALLSSAATLAAYISDRWASTLLHVVAPIWLIWFIDSAFFFIRLEIIALL